MKVMKRRWQVVHSGGKEQMVVCLTLARWDLVWTGIHIRPPTHTHAGQGEGTDTPGVLRSALQDKDARILKAVWQCKVH